MVILFATDDNQLMCHCEEEFTDKKRENDSAVESWRNVIKEPSKTWLTQALWLKMFFFFLLVMIRENVTRFSKQ